MSEHSKKELLIWLMVCVTVVLCSMSLSDCQHKKIDITCDVKEPACLKLLELNGKDRG
jgi:hypothetical protein